MNMQMIEGWTIYRDFSLVARVLFKYLIEKLKMFFGMLCCTVGQRLRALELA